MLDGEDWLQDPLMITDGGSYQYRKLKSPNEKQYQEWRLFHYSTRLKLKGANFFYTKVIDTARTSEDELRWYLDAFFFELIAACDILLQELNVIYEYDLDLQPNKVRWNTRKKNRFMERLPEEIFNLIEAERKKDWFCEVQWHRITTIHHYRTPITSSRRYGSLHLTNVGLQYIDKEGKIKIKGISTCKDYLSNMVNYISSVWRKMAQEFR